MLKSKLAAGYCLLRNNIHSKSFITFRSELNLYVETFQEIEHIFKSTAFFIDLK